MWDIIPNGPEVEEFLARLPRMRHNVDSQCTVPVWALRFTHFSFFTNLARHKDKKVNKKEKNKKDKNDKKEQDIYVGSDGLLVGKGEFHHKPMKGKTILGSHFKVWQPCIGTSPAQPPGQHHSPTS